MSSELYIQKNQSGEYHIFDDDNHQYWGPFYNLSDAQEMLAQIEGTPAQEDTMSTYDVDKRRNHDGLTNWCWVLWIDDYAWDSYASEAEAWAAAEQHQAEDKEK